MFPEYANARELELRTQGLIIEHRMAWEQLDRVEKLQAALRKAAAHVPFNANREALAR